MTADDRTEHTGADLAAWLAANPMPGASRTPVELDEQLAHDRKSWDFPTFTAPADATPITIEMVNDHLDDD